MALNDEKDLKDLVCVKAIPCLLLLLAGAFFGLPVQADVSVGAFAPAVIVCGEKASPAERYAAEELQWLFREATGHSLDIATEADRRGANIYVGESAGFRKSPVYFSTAAMGDEEFRVRIEGGRIAIAGGRPRGTLYGVYDFAERFLGVRFLTADHTQVPLDPDRMLPDVDYQYEPPFEMRWCYAWEMNEAPAFAARLRNNMLTFDDKFGGVINRPLISHSISMQVPVEQYGESHPEYYAWVDGERLLNVPGGPQVDPTNSAVADLVTDAVLKELAANPGQRVVSVSPNDHSLYSREPHNELIHRREGTPMGSHLALVNEVARRVAAVHPDVEVGTLAYWYTRTPPAQMLPAPNVAIQYCTFEATGLYPLNDPASETNAPVRHDLERWLELTPNVWLWHYITNLRHVDLPYPNLATLDDDIRYFRDVDVRGLFLQMNGRCPAGEWVDLRTYVASRLMWDPNLDGQALVDEFMALHYGPAAAAMTAYLSAAHEHALKEGVAPTTWSTAQQVGYDAALAERMLDFVDEALNAADDDAIRTRVEKASIGAYKAWLETAGTWRADGNIFELVYPEEFEVIYERYGTRCETFGMDRDAEFEPIANYYAMLERNRRGFGLEWLEGEAWSIACAPELGGDVVVMRHEAADYLSAVQSHSSDVPRGRWSTRFYLDREPVSLRSARREGEGLVLLYGEQDGMQFERILRVDKEGYSERWRVTNLGSSVVRWQIVAEPVLKTNGDGDLAVKLEKWEVRRDVADLEESERAKLHGAAWHGAAQGWTLTWTPGQVRLLGITTYERPQETGFELGTAEVELPPGGRFEAEVRFVALAGPPA